MKPVNMPKAPTEDVSYLAGVVSGDGTMTRYYVRISDSKEANVNFLSRLFAKAFGVKGKVRRELKRKFTLEIDSKAIVSYLNEKFRIPIGRKSGIIKVPAFLAAAPFRIKRGYIQGWLDSEGYLENWKKPGTSRRYLRVRFCSKSSNVSKWIAKELRKRGMTVSGLWYSSKVFRFQIADHRSIVDFIKAVGFRYPIKRAICDGIG